MSDRITAAVIREKKGRERITALTAYDAPMAAMLDAAGVDILLVGDSVGNTLLGYENPLPVTMEDMLHHAAAVSRGASRAMLVADMPFLAYSGVDMAQSLRNAGRFLKEAGMAAVKLEGGTVMAPLVGTLTDMGIPVMGHIGLTPQAVNRFGGYKVRGREREEAASLLESARALEAAGAFAIVLECIPRRLAALITQAVKVPTIGIGAGESCDGQILVINDLLGLSGDKTPRFVRRYLDLDRMIPAAVAAWAADVKNGSFPASREGYDMPESELKGLS